MTIGTASVNCSHFQSRMKYPSKRRIYSPRQYTNRIQVPDIMRCFGPTNSIAAKCLMCYKVALWLLYQNIFTKTFENKSLSYK